MKNKFFCLLTAIVISFFLCFSAFSSSPISASAESVDFIIFNGQQSNSVIQNNNVVSSRGLSSYQNKSFTTNISFVRCLVTGGASNPSKYIKISSSSQFSIYGVAISSNSSAYVSLGSQPNNGSNDTLKDNLVSNGVMGFYDVPAGEYYLNFNTNIEIYYLFIRYDNGVSTPLTPPKTGLIDNPTNEYRWLDMDGYITGIFVNGEADSVQLQVYFVVFNDIANSVYNDNTVITSYKLCNIQNDKEISYDYVTSAERYKPIFQINTFSSDWSIPDNLYDLYLDVSLANGESLYIAPKARYMELSQEYIGYNDGYEKGHTDGYNVGYNDGLNKGDRFNFFSLISAVVDAPIHAFYTLFNFDVLGVNLANFALGLFSLAVVLTILKIVFPH